MLMISRTEDGDLGCILKLEGKLLGPWIGELELACGEARDRRERIRLDLSGLTYLDADGTRFIEGLLREGTRLVACSGFVAEMLQRPRA
ncbi:STAS domain-containing protein [Singulisphaera rosea]